MKISEKTLQKAVAQDILSAEQADRLYAFLQTQSGDSPSFDFTNVLYYLGGMIAIGAMTLFMNLGWESFGGIGILVISLLYSAIGLLLTNKFANNGLSIPAGICATFVVAMTPLAIYGLQQALGVWPDDETYQDYHRYIQWHWLYMEFGTLVAGVILAWIYKYPFMTMPIAVTLWYLTMDVSAMLAGETYSWEIRSLVSMYLGLLMTCLAFWIDIRARHTADYAFWIYLFGVIAFWGGLSMQHSDSELSKFLYLCINLCMICVGVVLVRRIFVITGALGSAGYLGHLASNVFEDSWLFPISLTAIGLLIIYLGVLWQKHEKTLTQKLRRYLPMHMRELLESK